MGLTNKKEEQIKKMPIIRTRVFKSKSGRLLVHKTTITDIKPVEYYQAVFDGSGTETEEVQELEV